MPLGIMNILPFLKGWGYATYRIPTKTLVRGVAPIEQLRVDEEGLAYGIALVSNDVYATLILDYQGADLQTLSYHLNAEALRIAGGWAQDPSCWAQRYYRPLITSTAGVYYIIVHSGWQGVVFPYYRSIVLKTYLDEDSTQTEAQLNAFALVIRFTDKEAFIRTYRKFMGIKDLEIDPELLEVGPK